VSAPKSPGMCGSYPDTNHNVLARLIQVLAPGTDDLVAFIECYFDESGSHKGSPVLCVAGYLFEKEQCQKLDLAWAEVLHGFQLPYFRMVDCAHGSGPFQSLNMRERIQCETEMIKLIGQYAMLGLAIAVNENEYNTWLHGLSPAGDAYTFCCWQILAGIRTWIKNNQFQGEIAYFYEAGHESGSQANALMNRIFNNPKLRSEYFYAAHAFVDKRKVRPIQTADILAWHQATQVKRWLKNDPRMRADFRALTANTPHELFIANRKTAGGVIAYHRRLQGLPVDGITGAMGQTWFWCPFDGGAGFSV
jgi:Protein of unknown function (DUF3800)